MEKIEDRIAVVPCLLRMGGAATRGGAFWVVVALAFGVSTPSALAAGGGGAQVMSPPSGSTVDLAMSNYKFCRQAPCSRDEVAYARGLSGPVEGTDNPNKFVAVSPGDTVTWTYEDTTACDFYGTPPYPDGERLGCPGHDVTVEDGTADGRKVGFAPARDGRATITWAVPTDAPPGSVIRYFCDVRDVSAVPGGLPHWVFAMTGGLKVVARSGG